MSRFRRKLIELAEENARENALAPELDSLRREGMKLVFVECPYELVRTICFVIWHLFLLFALCLSVPFLVPLPQALLGAVHFAGRLKRKAEDERERNMRWGRRLDDFSHRWKEAKRKLQ